MYNLPAILATGIALASLWAGYGILANVWEPSHAWRWVLMSLAVFLFAIWRTWVAFRAGRVHPGGRGLSSLGTANCITLLRGLLLCALGGFIGSPEPHDLLAWVPGVIYAVAVCGDSLDGFVARLRKEASHAGEVLDREFDALGTMIAAVVGYHYGRLPLYYLVAAGAYYLFWSALWLRAKLGRINRPLARSGGRRAVASLQMLFLILVLVPLAGAPLRSVAATVMAALVLGSFVRDWLAVTGIKGRRA